MYCGKCGRQITGSENFCASCGSPVQHSGALPKSPLLQDVDSQQVAAAPLKAKQSSTTKTRRWLFFVLIGVVVLIVIAVVALSFSFCSSSEGLNDTNAQQENATLSALENAETGDVVHLGTVTFAPYWNPDEEFSEDIAWVVLDIQDDRVLLISEDIIDLRPYNEELSGDGTWENSDIRHWLNDEFYEGLPQIIQENIVETWVLNKNNPDDGTSGGEDTMDKVFFLSVEEVYLYSNEENYEWILASPKVSDSVKRTAMQFLNEHFLDSYTFDLEGVTFDELVGQRSSGEGEPSWIWWLRSAGNNPALYSSDISLSFEDVVESGYGVGGFVDAQGYIGAFGYNIYQGTTGVRPALWLEVQE